MPNYLKPLIAIVLFVTSIGIRQASPKADLVLWHQQNDEVSSQIARVFEEWAKVNAPGSTLTLVAKYDDDLAVPFGAAAHAHAAPDLLWADARPITALAAVLQPFEKVDAALYVPGIVDAVTVNGKVYGVPLQVGNHLMLLYNRQLVSQAPQTFAELITLGTQLQAQKADITALAYGERESLWMFPFAFGYGATIFASDGTTPALDSKEWLDAYQLVYDFRFKYKIVSQDCDYECADLGFRAGTTAMILNGDWALTGKDGYIALMGDELGIAPWPSVGDDPARNRPAPFIVGQYLAISADTTGDKLQVATAFAKYLSTEGTLNWTVPNYRLPALLSALHSDTIKNHLILSQTSRALENGVVYPIQPQMTCIFTVVSVQTRLLLNDSIKPGEAAREAQKNALECIAKLSATPVVK